MSDAAPPESEAPRFCSRCGVSLIPLEGSHISSDCGECGRKRYYVRTGEGGKGIKVQTGESFTLSVPPISLSPGPGKLMRAGLGWYLKMLFFPPHLRDAAMGFNAISKELEDQFDAIHRGSSFLADLGIDYDNPPQEYNWDPYLDAIKDDQSLPEFWAMHGSAYIARMKRELERNEAEAALVSMHAAVRCSSVLQTLGEVEETLWRGYEWNQKLFEVSGVQFGDPAKIEALETLAQRLQSLSDVALYDLVQDERNLSERLELYSLSGSEIKNVVTYTWESRQRRTQNEREDKRLRHDVTNMKVVATVAILAALISAAGTLLGMWLFRS